MILDLPKLFRRDRPQVHSPFGDISNMPHKIDHGVRMPSFDAMAADLDNSNSRSDSSLTLRGSVQPSYTSWTAEVGGSPEFSKFSFPSPSKIRWRAVDDLDTCTLFSEGDSGLPPKATYLFSLDEVHKRSYIPPLAIGLHDIVGEKQLVSRKDGFMYYDPSVAPLQHVISTRGLFVSCADPMLELETCLKSHAVRVFQEVPPVSAIVNGPYFRYIGDYYILRTQKTLPKTAWDKLSEDVKQIVVRRYIETVVTPADDPIPGNRYSAENVRKWYDNGNVLPLVVLRQTFRPPQHQEASKSSSSSLDIVSDHSAYSPEVLPEASTSGSSVSSSGSESVYFKESADENTSPATHDDDDSRSLCSEASACDTYTIASGVFLPAEEQEDTSPCSKKVIPSLHFSKGENDCREDVRRADAIIQLLEVEGDDGTSPLMIPFLMQGCHVADGDELQPLH